MTNVSVQATISEKEKKIYSKMEAYEQEITDKQDQLSMGYGVSNGVADLDTRNKGDNGIIDEARLQLVRRGTMNEEKLGIVTNDLDSALQRAAKAEKEVQRLQNELDKMDRSYSNFHEVDCEQNLLIHSKDNQIRNLLEENKKLSTKLNELKTESNRRVDELTRELERHVELVAELRAQLEIQADYEDIKKELRILRNIEFGEDGGFTSGGNTAATATAEVQLSGRSKALDELLIGKNRKLQDEDLEFRIRNQKQEDVIITEGQITEEKEFTDLFDLTGTNPSNGTLSDLFVDKIAQKLPGTNRALNLESDQQCATNLLNLFMCSASSSNGTSKLDNFQTANTLNLHDLPRTPAELKSYNELQDIIARNIRELGPKALNTTEIAKQCKHLMVTHNIGQRLFAKYVMNQVVKSQGSLSELLSKPRHWNKLTDKGREAFRRMYGWVSDSKAIELLCSVSPRRTHQALGKIEIEAPPREILWDSHSVSLAPVSRYNTDTSVVDAYTQKEPLRAVSSDSRQRERLATVVSGNGNSLAAQRASRWRHDDIPKEKIVKIYKRELALLKEQESHLEQAIGSRPSNMRNKDDKHPGAVEALNVSPPSLSSPSSLYGSFSTTDTSVPSQPNFAINSTQALFASRCRSGMTPITQEQLERHSVLDTEDIVRRIKDLLCLNLISQRQFGEHVLGLSQGSVSDLLARPKPWSMLTQKGREPFIRMQLFLNEAQSLCCKSETGLNGKFHEEQFSEVAPKNEACSNVRENAIDGLLSVQDFSFSEESSDEFPKYHCEVALRALKEESSTDGGKQKMKEKLLLADTSEIARQVRDRLQSSGISHKAFGDMLGISPGGVSELLSKPKTWEQLSPRAHELYLKMNDWLEEGNSSCTATPPLSSSITTTLSSMVETFTSRSISPKTSSLQKRKSSSATSHGGEPPKKAQRTVITDQQKEALKHVFERDQHPNQRTIEQLSQTLLLSTRTVSNWFHNYRTRQKASLKAKNLTNGNGDQKRTSTKAKNNNDRWKQDLAELMKLQSKPSHWSPTMVSSVSGNCLPRSSFTKNNSLDKAIERIQKLHAVKQL